MGQAVTGADLQARMRIRQFMPPLMIILVCIPTVLGLIPRNGLYGIRVREAFASDAGWYAINRIGSTAIIAASGVWLAAVHVSPRYGKAVGIAALVVTLVCLVVAEGWTI
jgi:hypothetical protein